MQTQRYIKFLIFIFLANVPESSIFAQDVELVGIELARFPENLEIGNASEAGTRIQFFVKDTAAVTGLTLSYKLKQWITDTGRDLHKEHERLARIAVQNNYRMVRDTALLSKRGFWPEIGKGFVFRLHSWALPDPTATSISIKAEVEYTVLVSANILREDITYLAGNIDGLTGFDFRGNTIALKQKTFGVGEEMYMTFNGTVTNRTHQTAIQTVQFLDNEGKVLDELYFGFNNNYNTNTRNRVDLKNAAIVRMYYQKIKRKKVVIEQTFGLGF